jgi:hypothetical protein
MEAPNSRSISKATSSTDEYDDSVIRSTSATTLSNRAATADKSQEEVLTEFATLLGANSSSANEQNSGFKELASLLSSCVDDDDVVLTVPALDLRLTEGDNGVLPEVGKHAVMPRSDVEYGTPPDVSVRPVMAASVLTMATEVKANIEQNAAQNIGRQTSWTKSTLRYASGAIGTNISESLIQLINSRVRAWTLLLLRHSISTGGNESRSRLLNMLSAKIKSESAHTVFKTLPLPPSAAGKPKESDVVLPLLFEAHVQLSIQGKSETILIRAPGTVSG